MNPFSQHELLDRLHAKIAVMAQRIHAPKELLPRREPVRNGMWITLYHRKANDGDDLDGWHLALMRNEDNFDWELSEVGVDYSENLLFVIFDEITSKMALDVQAGIMSVDQRAAWFITREKLLGQLKQEWAVRTAKRQTQHPSSD